MLLTPSAVRRLRPNAPAVEPTPDFSALQGCGSLAVAVSGGSDSLALLMLARDWACTQLIPVAVFALTVDHQLRHGSFAEAQQVSAWCKTLGIGHEILTWRGAKPDTGLQAKARRARYDLLIDWCKAHDVGALMTGHTADDQAETLYMRRLRTSSVQSLAGIWPERLEHGIRIVRPLLRLSRVGLQKFLIDRGQAWLSDPSNDDTRFERVRIRQHLAADPTFLGSEAEDAQNQISQARRAAGEWAGQHLKLSDEGCATFCVPAFSQLDELAQDLALQALLGRINGRKSMPEAARRKRVLQWLSSTENGRRCLGGVFVFKNGESVLMCREPGRIDPTPLHIAAQVPAIWDGRFQLLALCSGVVRPAGAVFLPFKLGKAPSYVTAGLPVFTPDGEGDRVPQPCPNFAVECRFVG